MFQPALNMYGSLSSEHSVGIEKRRFMPLEFNQIQVEIIRRTKHQFDPKGLLNPKKLLPEE